MPILLQLIIIWTLFLYLTIKDYVYFLTTAAIVGDITPSDGVPKAEKSRMEREALDHMCALLGESSRGKQIFIFFEKKSYLSPFHYSWNFNVTKDSWHHQLTSKSKLYYYLPKKPKPYDLTQQSLMASQIPPKPVIILCFLVPV
jgi:hypothetical protein